jgi:hypothetical protein
VCAGEALHSFQQLFRLLVRVLLVARAQGADDAVAHVVVENLEGERLERSIDCRDCVRMSMQ